VHPVAGGEEAVLGEKLRQGGARIPSLGMAADEALDDAITGWRPSGEAAQPVMGVAPVSTA
jgi:hypothetical protein